MLRELSEVVGAPHLVTDPDVLASHVVDWTGRFRGHTAAMVRPGSTAEVAGLLEVCRRHQVAVVAQGGNTGLVGASVPLAGELVVSTSRLCDLGDVDLAAKQITAGAGATVGSVQQAAAAAGLRYAVDFGARATATVGGSVATNAGGVNLLRYGGTREQLVGVEAVLGTGDVVSRRAGLLKDNTGYHLAGLLCGSEGTLGVVTAARLRLVDAPQHTVTALVGFTTPAAAVDAVSAWRRATDVLDAAEIVLADAMMLVVGAFGLPMPFDRPSAAYVLVEASSHDDPTDRLGALVAGAAGVERVAVASDAPRRSTLWRYRDQQTAAIATVGVPHKYDVTVPIGRLAEFIAEVPRVVTAVAPGATTWLFGHVGDGNIHVNVTGVAPEDDRLDRHVLGLVVSYGGSISAEHGIGTAKARWLALDRSAGELAAMRSIKRALDPAGILNPAALVPSPTLPA